MDTNWLETLGTLSFLENSEPWPFTICNWTKFVNATDHTSFLNRNIAIDFITIEYIEQPPVELTARACSYTFIKDRIR